MGLDYDTTRRGQISRRLRRGGCSAMTKGRHIGDNNDYASPPHVIESISGVI